MSRVDRTDLIESPCSKFLQWKTIKETIVVDGDEMEKLKGGHFAWYDKGAEKNIVVPKPFKFAILNNDLVTFKGFNEGTRMGVWSNEVSSKPEDKDQLVTLRNKNGVLMTFKISDYKAKKDEVEGHFAKYGRSVYIAVKNEKGEFEIQNLQLIGAPLTGGVDFKAKNPEEALDGWFNFTRVNKNKLWDNWIVVEDYKVKKKGTNKYTIPVYKMGEALTPAENKQLDDLDTQLKQYLKAYFAKNQTPAAKETEVEQEVTADTDSDDMGY